VSVGGAYRAVSSADLTTTIRAAGGAICVIAVNWKEVNEGARR
jgi:hypothetical protein